MRAQFKHILQSILLTTAITTHFFKNNIFKIFSYLSLKGRETRKIEKGRGKDREGEEEEERGRGRESEAS